MASEVRPDQQHLSTSTAPTSAQLHSAAETFAMLATPTRLHLVWLLAQQDRDVGSLAESVGVPVATVSQHLAKLRFTGLVTSHRDGRRQIYSVDDPHVVTLVDQIFRHISPDGTLSPDGSLTAADALARAQATIPAR
ncbi:MAG: winged helix-turn-helix transcriptional regulator [Dactylosporangium sp.]|nr:metalloregulator ArsR/SmtB family transcription factor [Dactylosporangium sp.]NNJ60890.1 winged helix-turn-helix transcriptional regulator [Dactylosporangium sp.]